MTPAEQEAIFAAIGLLPILRAKPQLHRHQWDKAAGLQKQIRNRMAAFLGSSEWAEAHDMPEFDYAETLELVSSGQTPEQTAALMAAVPDPELASDILLKAAALQAWAKALIPREEHSGFMGLSVDPPDPVALGDFRRVWAVACDPLAILDDLEDGSLSEDQVGAVAQLYPATYAEMRQAVSDSAAQLAARRGKDWQPSPTKAALVGVLRGEQVVDLAIAADVQAMFAQQEAQQVAAVKAQQQAARGGGGAASQEPLASTPGQDAAAG